MNKTTRVLPTLGVVALLGMATSAFAAPTFFGPTPYLSTGDIPAGFYDGGSPTGLENFEDGVLDFGITASTGGVIGPGGLTDSVDADDGTIDGSGTNGHSWFSGFGAAGVIFTFSGPLPTAAGIVWTDGAGTTTFEAFGPGMVSLGTFGPFAIADNIVTGQTAEDRFFGVQDLGGILAIKLSNTSGGIEMDHVQFGAASSDSVGVPEPGAAGILLLGLMLVGSSYWFQRRKPG